MKKVTDDERFLFDLQGFLILRGAIESDTIKAMDEAIKANEAIDHDESWVETVPESIRDRFTPEQKSLTDWMNFMPEPRSPM